MSLSTSSGASTMGPTPLRGSLPFSIPPRSWPSGSGGGGLGGVFLGGSSGGGCDPRGAGLTDAGPV